MAPTKAFKDALRKQDVGVPLAEVFTTLSQVSLLSLSMMRDPPSPL
jgi:hypothetical protein